MMLCLDIGNSTVFMGLVESGRVLDFTRIPVAVSSYLDRMAEFTGGRRVEVVAISSVVPDKTINVVEAVRQLTSLTPFLVKKELQPAFRIALDRPETLGADRIADATAAIRDYPLPVIIVDLGTATTFSVINNKGVFLGGAICPGITTSFRALTEKAAQLKGYNLDLPEKVIGTNTADCINSGIIAGHASLIDGMVKRIEEETHDRYTVVLTGGMSATVAPFCQCSLKVDKTLILRGIYYLLEA